MPRALTIILLLQPAQDPEDPSFWDFQGVCLLQVVGQLLPGPQLAYGRFHLSGLTGAFLQLPLVIAGEAVPAQLSLALFNSPSSLTERLFYPASSGAHTSPGVRRPGFSSQLLPLTSCDHGQVIALLWACHAYVKMGGNGSLFPVIASHFSELQVSPG